MIETQALLLTDVVDSTRLSEQLGDVAMAELWAKHDRVARDLLPLHGGREIDKTDGFLMLFERAADAAHYAAAYHRALRPLGIAARAGLHVGDVILTRNAPADIARGAKPLEVDGIAKPTAARVMSVARGGQTLLTLPAVQALGETELRLQSHGHWRMKGVSTPMELFEVGDEEAPFVPPPDAGKVYRVVEQGGVWLPARAVKHSLPAERDAFVGRSADLQTMAALVRDSRLVTVLGIGGTGKTRLVTRFGWTWLGDFPGGVWFCDLSEARAPEGVVSAVARALDVPLGRDEPVVKVGHALAGRGECLVVLDNFEQVNRHAQETLGVWLDRAPSARFVVTSREVLGLPGESTLPLAPLVAAECTELFIARARQAKPAFEPNDLPSIRALVELLEGLPLAIELAAARVRVMPPRTLVARMSQRFKLLASSGGRHTRQATLRGALDWSWDLLEPDERMGLAQLSVFEGGFDLEAAEAVLLLDDLWGVDVVQALVDKSLVRRIGEDRFDLLVSVQEYASEKLHGLGGRTEAEIRHEAWFGQFGQRAALDALEVGAERLRTRMLDFDNFVIATRRSASRGDGRAAVSLLNGAWGLMRRVGPVALAIELCEHVGALQHLSEDDRAEVLWVRARAEAMAGRATESLQNLDLVLDAARGSGDRWREGRLLSQLSMAYWHFNRIDDAWEAANAGLQLARETSDRILEGHSLSTLGTLCRRVGQLEQAQVHAGDALAIALELGHTMEASIANSNLGILHAMGGRHEESHRCFVESLALARDAQNRGQEAPVLCNLGILWRERGDLEQAAQCLLEALSVAREMGDYRYQGNIHSSLAATCVERGLWEEAGRHLEEGERILRDIGNAYELGLLLCHRARYEASLEEVGRAGATVAEIAALVERHRVPSGSELAQALAAVEASLNR